MHGIRVLSVVLSVLSSVVSFSCKFPNILKNIGMPLSCPLRSEWRVGSRLLIFVTLQLLSFRNSGLVWKEDGYALKQNQMLALYSLFYSFQARNDYFMRNSRLYSIHYTCLGCSESRDEQGLVKYRSDS
nr:hypothetical protein [Zea mays]